MSAGRTAGTHLQVAHLLGWITGISIALAAFYWVRQIDPQTSASTAQRIRELALCLSYGAGICGAAFLLARRLGGAQPNPTQPGHWMLVILGAVGLLDGLVLLGGAWLRTRLETFDSGAGMYWIWIAQIASAMVAAAIAAEIALNPQRGAAIAWRRFAGSAAVLLALQATWALTSRVTYQTWPLPAVIEWTAPLVLLVGIPLVLVFLAIAVLDDRRQRRFRDWLHFAGVGAAAVFAATHWALDVWNRGLLV